MANILNAISTSVFGRNSSGNSDDTGSVLSALSETLLYENINSKIQTQNLNQ